MRTREKVRVSPVYVPFTIFLSGSSRQLCRPLTAGAYIYSGFSLPRLLLKIGMYWWSLSFLHCCLKWRVGIPEFYSEAERQNFYFQTVPWTPDSDISQLIISATPFKKEPQKAGKTKDSKTKQMSESFRLAQGTVQADQRGRHRCSRPCSYRSILLYIIPGGNTKTNTDLGAGTLHLS